MDKTTTDWIETRSGEQFSVSDPHRMANSIHAFDVAWALSRTCRYGGHTRRWYSVAEHCCLMADWVEAQPWSNARDALTALHHDDAEYVMGDLPRPVKMFTPDFKRVEDFIDQAVSVRFGTIYPLPDWLREADARIIRDERPAVMARSPHVWGTDSLEPLGVRPWGILGQYQWYARLAWLRRHRRLSSAVTWDHAWLPG